MDHSIILLHGFLERREMWGHLSIAQKEEVFIPNLPGHGSDATPFVQNIEDMAHWLNSRMEAENLQKSILIGHSMGGYLAAEYYRKWPEKVAGIIMLQSQAGDDEADKKEQRDRAINLVRRDKKKYCSAMIRGLFGKYPFPQSEDVLNRLITEACEMSSEAIISSLKAMKNRKNNREVLRQRSIPLLYILGDEDPRLPHELMQKDLKATQADQVQWISKCGHMAQWEKPESLDKIIVESLAFIQERSG